MSAPLDVLYPNGKVEAVLTYIWTGGQPVVWDGTVTVGSVTSSGVIADGVNNAILATVLDIIGGGGTANPLTVAIVDTTGAQISSFGGGTQYTVGNTVSSPTGNVILWQDTGPALRAVSASKPLPVAVIGAVDVTGSVVSAVVSGTVSVGNTVSVTVSGTPSVTVSGTVSVSNTVTTVITTGKTLKVTTGSTTADTDIISAVSSKRLKVFAYSFFTFGTSASTLLLKSNGTSGTEVWRLCLQSVSAQVMGANLATSVPSFLFATDAGEKLTLDVGNSDTINYSLSYWDDDAT